MRGCSKRCLDPIEKAKPIVHVVLDDNGEDLPMKKQRRGREDFKTDKLEIIVVE